MKKYSKVYSFLYKVNHSHIRRDYYVSDTSKLGLTEVPDIAYFDIKQVYNHFTSQGTLNEHEVTLREIKIAMTQIFSGAK